MSLAIVYSRACSGISAPLVTVEVHISRGFPGLNIVGLPEAAVKESKYRVRSALLNTAFEFPRRRITINLAPADLPKEGSRFDLPIALGILAASGQIPNAPLEKYEFTGELALSGELRPVHGVLPVVLCTQQTDRQLIIPQDNASEAALAKRARVFFAKHILEVCAHLNEEQQLPICSELAIPTQIKPTLDLIDVHGQLHAKRALEVAAAGKHSLLFIGPPGTGKTMLANRLPSILPPLNEQQALEVASIFSVSSSGFKSTQWEQIPFRSPHHSASSVALVGGGRPPRPGEISLAHHGVLFLDELPEFGRHVLESLREPLESGHITISRAAYQEVFPARFQLVAAMNPCPCGYAGSPKGDCHCTSEQIQRYLVKLSGPLLDRIDMHVEVPSLPPELLAASIPTGGSVTIKEKVMIAVQQQLHRQGKYNTELSVTEIGHFCQLDEVSQILLNQVMNKLNLSARVYHRILKMARTIADLSASPYILREHMSEALTYRCLDRSSVV